VLEVGRGGRVREHVGQLLDLDRSPRAVAHRAADDQRAVRAGVAGVEP
jgi:hypothetical protein